MSDLVVWQGPVYSAQVPGATVRGAKELFIGCTGDGAKTGKPDCPNIGEQLRGDPARLLAKAGMDEAELGDLFLAGFSAGGSLIKRLLENVSYRDLVTAVYLADATYTSLWADKATRTPPPIEGFTRYAVDVVRGPGDKLLVATASPIPNGQWGTGVENLHAIMDEIERRTGKTFVERADFFGIEPKPESVYQLGNVIIAPYPLKPVGHGHTAIAPQVFQRVIQPWLDKGKGPIDQASGLGPLPAPPTPTPVDPSNGPPAQEQVSWLKAGLALAAGVSVGSAFAWLFRRS